MLKKGFTIFGVFFITVGMIGLASLEIPTGLSGMVLVCLGLMALVLGE